jgi:hypothetical protein
MSTLCNSRIEFVARMSEAIDIISIGWDLGITTCGCVSYGLHLVTMDSSVKDQALHTSSITENLPKCVRVRTITRETTTNPHDGYRHRGGTDCIRSHNHESGTNGGVKRKTLIL